MLIVAMPGAFSVRTPSTVLPFLKVTVPVGMPVAGVTVLTVAEKVIDWPNTVELDLATMVLVVSATVWLAGTVGVTDAKAAAMSRAGPLRLSPPRVCL